MGIDKPDVRLVIHYGLSKTIEGYYQQTGRAGRDGMPSRALLFWNRGDPYKIQDRNENEKRKTILKSMSAEMESFAATDTQCRRAALLKYLGESPPETQERCCDVCDRAQDPKPKIDVSKEARLLLQTATHFNGRYGFTKYVDVITGANKSHEIPGAKNLSCYGSMNAKTDGKRLKALGHLLVSLGFMNAKSERQYTTFFVSDVGSSALKSNEPILVTPSDEL